MSKLSNNYGRAFEFIAVKAFESEISKKCKVELNETGGYSATKNAWDSLSDDVKMRLQKSAFVAVEIVLGLEPLIIDKSNDPVLLRIQTDKAGKEGDVRDIIIERPGIEWVIGLSLKHNHSAVKHSRLSGSIDFGKIWFTIPCSEHYWSAVNPVFNMLEFKKKNECLWRDIPDKSDSVYEPILKAFIDEIHRSSIKYPKKVPREMTMYLLGINDFYKVMTVDKKKLVNVKAFNLYGTLGSDCVGCKSSKVIVVPLPDRIINIAMKPRSKSTVELYLNKGWSFSFRIHSASTKVEPSLKFDINLIGHPIEMLSIIKRWS